MVTPKVALHAEGRSANLPVAIANMQPVLGGRKTVYIEINPQTARERGIANGARVRLTSELGHIEGYCKYYEGCRPDTLVFPMEHGHWAHGRWAKDRLPGHCGEITVNQSDRVTGQCSYYTTKVSIEAV